MEGSKGFSLESLHPCQVPGWLPRGDGPRLPGNAALTVAHQQEPMEACLTVGEVPGTPGVQMLLFTCSPSTTLSWE